MVKLTLDPPLVPKWFKLGYEGKQCPADPAPSVESGWPTTGPSPRQELEACLIPLIAALSAQTKAINRLAQSNELLVQAMAEADGDEAAAPTQYMNGRPVR